MTAHILEFSLNPYSHNTYCLIPKREEMLAKNFLNDGNPINPFLVQMDEQELGILDTPEEKKIDRTRKEREYTNIVSYQWGGATAAIGTVVSTTLKICGHSFKQCMGVTGVVACGVMSFVKYFGFKYYTAYEKGTGSGESRVARLKNKIELIGSELQRIKSNLNPSKVEKIAINQLEKVRSKFNSIYEHYKEANDRSCNKVNSLLFTTTYEKEGWRSTMNACYAPSTYQQRIEYTTHIYDYNHRYLRTEHQTGTEIGFDYSSGSYSPQKEMGFYRYREDEINATIKYIDEFYDTYRLSSLASKVKSSLKSKAKQVLL